jgi:hypothetical protein
VAQPNGTVSDDREESACWENKGEDGQSQDIVNCGSRVVKRAIRELQLCKSNEHNKIVRGQEQKR